MDHARVAKTVLAAVGGADNVSAAAHCATRLRLVLIDKNKIDQPALDNDPDIKGTFSAGGLFQVIVGPGDVDIVFDHLVKSGVRELSKDEAKQEAAKQDNILIRLIKTLSDVFVPILPALIAGGLMMALNNVLTAAGLFGPKSLIEMWPAIKDLADMINMFAAAPFAFLPVLIGYSAVKRFGGNPYLGAAMGAAMVFPSLINGYNVAQAMSDGTMTYWNLFGLNVAKAGYQGTVIPVLLVSLILASIEKGLHKVLKGTTDFLLTPLLTMLSTGFLAFILVGPFARILGDSITFGLQWLYNSTGIFGGLIFGFLYSPIVITGLHQSFPAIELPMIAEFQQGTGPGSFIFPIAAMANIAQGAATLAVFLIAKEGKLKGMAGASAASALMGITEPAIFGVNLRLRWPFFVAISSAAVGGILISLFNVRAVALGAAGLIGFVSINPTNIAAFLAASAVVFALSFTSAFVYGRTKGKASILGTKVDETSDVEAAPVTLSASAAHDFSVTSPISGKLIALSDVKDQTFARGILGPGAAIEPSGGPVVSPVDGEIIVAFPTKHAYGIRSASGIEILIHIGMDTVQLDGEHFTSAVLTGQTVRRGDVLAEVDWKAVAKAGYDITTPVVVTNAASFDGVNQAPSGSVDRSAPMFDVVAKPATVS